MTTENVLCVPTAILWPDPQQTSRPCQPAELESIIAEHGVVVPRYQCETDESLQQIIPHIVLTCGDHVLAYTRLGGSEKRLNGVISVGFGGHINDGDQGEDGPLWNGLRREYREEMDSRQYLHRSCVPLDQVVLTPVRTDQQKRMNFAVSERDCLGYCGR